MLLRNTVREAKKGQESLREKKVNGAQFSETIEDEIR